MTEEDARASIAQNVSRETLERLGRFVDLLKEAASAQNLIAASTLPEIWKRHILDSAQLTRFDIDTGAWLDIGSGAGLPGLVIAMMTSRPVILAEPRQLRVAFLEHCIKELGLVNRVTIHSGRVERLRHDPFAVISARAVAGISDTFAMARHLADGSTRWILPKGRTADADMAEAQRSWQAEWVKSPSITDSDSTIVIATNVRVRGRR